MSARLTVEKTDKAAKHVRDLMMKNPEKH